MKSTIIPSVLLLLVSLMSLGCVSKGTYQTAIGERDQVKQQLATVTQERDTVQIKLTVTESSLASTQKERDDLLSRLIETRSTLTSVTKARDDLQTKLATTETDLAAANAGLTTTTADLTRTRSDLTNATGAFDTLNTQTKQAQKYWNIANSYLGITEAGLTGKEALSAFEAMVRALTTAEDSQLTAAWDKYRAVLGKGDSKQQFLDFIVLLRQRLAVNQPKTR